MRLLGYLIETANLQDDQVLVYDSNKQKWVNKPRNTNTDSTINGIPVVELQGRIQHGDVLVYCSRIQKFIPKPKDYIQEIDITETGEIHKLPRVSSDGLLHVNISGYASGLNGKLTDASNAVDGDVLVYRASQGKFICEPKGNSLGEGRSLRIYDGVNLLGEYNGSQLTTIDISSVQTQALQKLEWQLAEVALALKKATNTRAYITDALFEDFEGDLSTLDTTTTSVTCIFASMMEIEIDSIENIVVGGIYTISDGNNSEEIQVESMTSEDGRYRLRLVNAIQNSYVDGQAMLTRSNVRLANWLPMESVTWEEISAEEEITLSMDFTQGINFQVFGGSVNSDGEIIMGQGNGTEYCLEFVREQYISNHTPQYRWKRVNWTRTPNEITWSDY